MKIALQGFCSVALLGLAANSASAAEPSTTPKRFSAQIGGFMGASYSVELRNGVLIYTASGLAHSSPKQQTITPTTAQWLEFRQTLDNLKVWRWRTVYPNHDVADGTQWSFDIAYADHTVHTRGNNNYPDESGKQTRSPEPTKAFNRFLAAIQKLLGDKTFQ